MPRASAEAGNVVKDYLVRAFFIIASGAFHRIADVLVAREFDALGQPPGAYVQTGDHPFTQHGAPPGNMHKNCATRPSRPPAFFRVELRGPEPVAAVKGAELAAIPRGGDYKGGIGLRIVTMHKIKLRCRLYARQQATGLMRAQAVPAHVRHRSRRAVLLPKIVLKATADAGHNTQARRIIFLAAFQQYLTAQADTQKRAACGHSPPQGYVQPVGLQRPHGLARSPHAGEDDAQGAFEPCGIRGNDARYVQMFQGAAHACLVARFIFQNGQHGPPSVCNAVAANAGRAC